MQRHGWTFCLGLLVIGLASAQPPADLERYPPAPDLPGVVVGQSNAAKAATKPTSGDAKLVSANPDEPAPAPRSLEGEPKPTGPAVSVVVSPTEGAAKPTLPAPAALGPTNDKNCKLGCGSGDCMTRITDWLCFKSHARQHCYPSPYRPPLFTWFKCEPMHGPCATGKCGVVAAPTPVTPLPESALPAPAPAGPNPTPKTPSEKGGVTREVPAITIEPEADLPGAIRVDTGLRFSPGGAPMAKPTTQVERVSTWRPK